MRSLRWTPFLFAVAACGDNHPQNQPPIVADREVTTPEDTALEFAVAATDPEGKALDIRLTGAQHGQLVSTATSWRYTPASDYHGPDQLLVTVSDGELTSTARLDLTITPVNDAPVAADDSFAVAEDGRLEIQFATFMANDTDVDGPAPTMLGLTPGSGGEVTMADGRVTFVPTVDYVGEATFTYSISDGEFSAIGRVTVLVGGVNDAPTAAADVVAGTEDTELVIPVATLLANDTDVEGQTLAIASVTDAVDGEVVLDGTVVRFTPGRDHAGAASFAYVVTDGAGTDRGAVTIELTAVDDPPTLAGGAATVDEDAALVLPLAGADVDSTSLTYAIATPPAHGAASIVGAELRYQPSLNYHGADALTVTVSDGLTTSAPAPIALTIAGVIECGDGEREGGEACDDGNAIDSDACLTSCAAAACGDGVIQAGVEACDDGNAIDTDACRTSCAVATCGDGVVRAGVEACDDGNAIDTDACRTSCVAATCGDGVVRAGVEACDDGNAIDTDACRTSCAAATCGDGVIQAGVEACDDGNAIDTDACRTSCAVASCGDGVVQAGVEACDDGNSDNADACLNACVAATCGDGVVQAGVEACDDANAIDTDACLTSCVAAACGDGVVQAGLEACDDGNAIDTDACRTSCVAATCGDGLVQAGVEACDDGNAIDTDACLTSCVAAACGDGFVRAGLEACDDANAIDTDGCLSSCVAATCGDGLVQAGVEACDDGNGDNTDGCLSSCAAAACGDGFVQAGLEGCDDGNGDNTDACLTSCVVATCGDGSVQAGLEACDDGNGDNTDGCLTSCVAAACGDGFVQAGLEACDDANGDNTDACLNTCVVATCGDGSIRAGLEACDDGNGDNTDACLNTCVAATCGDGFVRAGLEACDDGDSDNTDACLNTCAAATCGDGVVQAGLEVCDDGNSDPADACDACLPTTPPVCGDGTVDAGEECDDGNLDDQDACSHACLDEYCGDGAVQYGLGEICDDGNGNTGDGCDVTCQLEGGFTTIAPVLVSGAMSCTISQSNTGRKVAIDSLGNVYVAMVCGGNAYVAISSDRGQTYGAPVALGMTGINEMAIAAGAPGTAYVAASGGGVARFTRTEDAGATWSAPIDLASSSDFEISIEAFNDDVFVGVGGGSGVIVLRNSTRGVGAFTQTDVAVSQVFFDVIYDDRTDTLLVCTDTPDFHLRVSTDRGATFASEVNPTGMAFYSDWAIGNGVIYVAGTSSGSDNLLLIPAASPGTSSSVAGLPMTNQSSQRALAADPSGNSYIATTLDSGAVQLDRLLYGTTTFAAPRTVIASGTYPGVTALPTSNGVAMIYASAAGGIYATIQTY